MLDIEIAELRRIFGRSEDVNAELKENCDKIITELNNICANVKSTGLSDVNKEFTEYLNEVATELNNNLATVIAFLKTQLAAYEGENVDAEAGLSELSSQLDSII